MVNVKYSSAIFLVGALAAPVFAAVIETRDLSEISEVVDRDLTNTEAVYARELDELFARVAEDLEARDLDYQELSARRLSFKGFFKKVWGGIKKAASFVIRRENGEELEARDFEELEDRELDELIQRHFEQVEERSPGFTHHVNKIAQGQSSEVDAREFDDLEERDLELDLDLVERDLEEDDLFERDIDDVEDMLERDLEEDFQEREIDELD